MGDRLIGMVWALPTVDQALIDDFAASGVASHKLIQVTETSSWGVVSSFLRSAVGMHTTADSRYTLVSRPFVTVNGTRLHVEITVGWHPSYDAASVIASLTVAPGVVAPEHLTDLTVALLHSFKGRATVDGAAIEVASGVDGACSSVYAEVVRAVADVDPRASAHFDLVTSSASCVEIRERTDASARWDSGDLREAYAMATGDEGWRWIDKDLAASRLGRDWATRDFVDVRTAGDGVVIRNFKGDGYQQAQSAFTTKYFGVEVDYFGRCFEVVGLDHGVLHVLERVTIRRALAQQWLEEARHEENAGSMLRQRLDSVHSLIGSALIAEVDSLEHMLADRLGLGSLIHELDRRAESLDEATRFAYEERVNKQIARLTRITALLAAMTFIAAVIPIFRG